MPTLYFIDFSGNIDQEEADEQEDSYSIAEGPRAGSYPKLKANKLGKRGFFLSWGAAREAAVDVLDSVIARNERDLELLKEKRQELDQAPPAGQ